MAEDINLLPQEAVEKEVKKGSYNRTINIAAIVSLLVVAALLIGLFGYQLLLASFSKRIDSQTQDAEQSILDQSSKEITHRALVEKLDDASKFLASRLPFSDSYTIILDVLKKSGAVLTDGKLNNDGTFTISGDAKSSENLEKLINSLTDSSVRSAIDDIKLVSLTKIPTEPYKFTIDYKFLKKGLFEASSSAEVTQP